MGEPGRALAVEAETGATFAEFLKMSELCVRHFPDYERLSDELGRAGAALVAEYEEPRFEWEPDGLMIYEAGYVFGDEDPGISMENWDDANATVAVFRSVDIAEGGEPFGTVYYEIPAEGCEVTASLSNPDAFTIEAGEAWLRSVLPTGSAFHRRSEQTLKGSYTRAGRIVELRLSVPALEELFCGDLPRCNVWSPAALDLKIQGEPQ